MEENKRKIGHLLKGPKRMEGESFEKYKIRRRAEEQMVKQYLRGELIPNNNVVVNKDGRIWGVDDNGKTKK